MGDGCGQRFHEMEILKYVNRIRKQCLLSETNGRYLKQPHPSTGMLLSGFNVNVRVLHDNRLQLNFTYNWNHVLF